MTKKEAIEHLRELKTLKIEFPNTLQEQALDIAIHALETGEVYMNGKDYDLYLEGYKQGKKDFERPQGEWIEKEETPASVSYYCSVCKTEGIPITPFCPWCGAKMKGGAENDNNKG